MSPPKLGLAVFLGGWHFAWSVLVFLGWAQPAIMAYRAVDNYVWERVRYFLGRRHKVPSRGTERYSGDVVFGELGVFRLRCFALGSPAHARV